MRSRVPVIAAGGIVDGRGIAAAFALGAAGVQLGTAYLDCPEATISPCTVPRWPSARPADRHHQCAERTPARADPHALRARARARQRRAIPNYPLATPALLPLRAKAEAKGSRRFLVAMGRSVSRPQPQPWGRRR